MDCHPGGACLLVCLSDARDVSRRPIISIVPSTAHDLTLIVDLAGRIPGDVDFGGVRQRLPLPAQRLLLASNCRRGGGALDQRSASRHAVGRGRGRRQTNRNDANVLTPCAHKSTGPPLLRPASRVRGPHRVHALAYPDVACAKRPASHIEQRTKTLAAGRGAPSLGGVL